MDVVRGVEVALLVALQNADEGHNIDRFSVVDLVSILESGVGANHSKTQGHNQSEHQCE